MTPRRARMAVLEGATFQRGSFALMIGGFMQLLHALQFSEPIRFARPLPSPGIFVFGSGTNRMQTRQSFNRRNSWRAVQVVVCFVQWGPPSDVARALRVARISDRGGTSRVGLFRVHTGSDLRILCRNVNWLIWISVNIAGTRKPVQSASWRKSSQGSTDEHLF